MPVTVTVTYDLTFDYVIPDDVTITATADGPGSVELAGSSCETTTCTAKVARGSTVRVNAKPHEPHDGFIGFKGCPGNVTYGADGACEFVATADATLEAVFDPIVSYAPWVQFHPDEDYYPMDPDDFVRASSLQWANPSGRRTCTDADKTIAKAGKVIASWLPAATHYKYRYCYRVLGQDRHKTFNTKQLTAPSLKTKDKAFDHAGRWGFFLNVRNSEWQREAAPLGLRYTNAPPMMVEYASAATSSTGSSSAATTSRSASAPDRKDHHEGDWERIAVRLDKHNRATAVALLAALLRRARSCRGIGCEANRRSSTKSHPSVFVALGAHATYKDKGSTTVACKEFGGVLDSHPGGGLIWETWQNGKRGFEEATRKPWYGFGGGWGSKTKEGSNSFWGPLGPGPKKPAAPAGW